MHSRGKSLKENPRRRDGGVWKALFHLKELDPAGRRTTSEATRKTEIRRWDLLSQASMEQRKINRVKERIKEGRLCLKALLPLPVRERQGDLPWYHYTYCPFIIIHISSPFLSLTLKRKDLRAYARIDISSCSVKQRASKSSFLKWSTSNVCSCSPASAIQAESDDSSRTKKS